MTPAECSLGSTARLVGVLFQATATPPLALLEGWSFAGFSLPHTQSATTTLETTPSWIIEADRQIIATRRLAQLPRRAKLTEVTVPDLGFDNVRHMCSEVKPMMGRAMTVILPGAGPPDRQQAVARE
ncbi:hypothetical protein CC85DRAFT_284165 [Cutaneotrichosporon oleaginosum]|uniref:Uncharacterized protein n=1 Tax=Cutaneotrichosporon oleaginosum TaxID=879819 RepID=A0A0J0XS16_9TREE|nr:uncharacterized protein CC85DRAFT_284165 [Cutaneotrichosporon oleaginosum]KLT43885.1 hypothetical protein CC85DRAFT_284165 [Cutaneotrichosporon oleaginosum]TXT06375.1 hypothetical protein COLE_05706 [Cutaneotrichosporon oleaginosum]